MKQIKLNLSEKSIDSFIKKLEAMKQDLDNIDKEIVDELSSYTEKQIENNLSKTQFKDGNDDTSVGILKEGNKKARVRMYGSQAYYNEFGTGTEGLKNPHPEKSKYSLNGYNTGKRIRDATESVNNRFGIPVGVKYWVYKDKSGNDIATTGIPAGKQVFNAAIALRKKKSEVIKRKVGDLLSKL